MKQSEIKAEKLTSEIFVEFTNAYISNSGITL